MQPPTPTGRGSGILPTAASASPFISLSLQCDLLNYIGSQPHSYAAISEQTVYTRAAEQLRFHTPSPLLSHPRPPVSEERSTDAVAMGSAEVERPPMPYVCATSAAPVPFPPISWFEQRRRAELLERRKKEGEVSAGTRVAGSVAAASTAAIAVAPLPSEAQDPDAVQLVSSATGLAGKAFLFDYPTVSHSNAHISTVARAEEPPLPMPQDSKGDDVPAQGGSSGSTLPTPALHFPSAVVMRATSQMVLTLQLSAQTSAATFALVQYRGVQLPNWAEAVRRAPALATSMAAAASAASSSVVPSVSRLRDALVFSVLPQVVAEQWGRAKRGQPSSDVQNAAYFYLLAADDGVAGMKRSREDGEVQHEGQKTASSDGIITPRMVSCVRLGPAEGTASRIPLQFAALSPAAFESWQHRTLHRTEELPQQEWELSLAGTTLYDSEAHWLTRGVVQHLFTYAADGPSTATEEEEVEERRSAQAAFLKRSAFLFLSFTVHRSWCLCVYEALEAALLLRLPALSAAPLSSPTALHQGASFSAVHVTCLPAFEHARRSPQHEWKSELSFRLVAQTRDHSTAAAVAARPPCLWQLSVTVSNRSPELQWCRRGSQLPREALAGASTGEISAPEEGTGTLDELVAKL